MTSKLAQVLSRPGEKSPIDEFPIASSVADQRPLKLSCKGLWKVYGSDHRLKQTILSRNDLDANGKVAQLRHHGMLPAVADITLDVRQGEILMVMGLSGSGKSTMIRCLSRLIEPDTGEVHLGGVDLLKASRSQLTEVRRREIGMVFQSFGLMEHLSALDNVAFPLRVRGLAVAERRQKAMAMLQQVGLAERAHNYPSELSGGQQQRIGIARSLVADPEIWFLDEPFSALDPMIRKQMQDDFRSLQSRLQKTIVFVTHDFLEAARLGDRIIIMKDGQIIQAGTIAELLLNPVNDYVRDFAADVPAFRVLKASHVMRPVAPGDVTHGVPSIHEQQAVEEAFAYFLEGAETVLVTTASREVTGVLDRRLMKSLLNRTKRSAHD